MAFRTSPLLHLQSSSIAQPLVGSWIQSGIGAPSGQPLTLTLGTIAAGSGFNDSNIFRPGDKAFLIDPNGANFETVNIQSIGGNANTVVLGPQTTVLADGRQNPVTINTHVSGAFGTGTFIALALDINNVFVQMADGTSGAFSYIGDSYNMTATYRCIVELAKVASSQQPYYWASSMSLGVNPYHTSELWILGGSGVSSDAYRVTFAVT